MGKRALKHRVSLAVAGLRRFVLALLSALLVGCGGGGSGRQQPSLNPEPPGNEAPVFTSSTTATVNQNPTAASTAVATDPDGDALTRSLDGSDVRDLSGLKLKPGMTANASIRTGKRTVLPYPLKPIHRAFQGALSER